MFYKNNKNAEVADWNMAADFLSSLNELRVKVTESSIREDLIVWYRGLKSLYRWIHFKVLLNDKEIKKKNPDTYKDLIQEPKFNKLFEGARVLINDARKTRDPLYLKNSISEAEVILDELEIKINDALFIYGLVFPKVEEEKSMEERLEEEFHK